MISAIVVTWNSEQTIGDCIASVLAQDLSQKEVILVDNASADQTLAVSEKFPGLKILRNSSNLGFCAANNQGIRIAAGEYLLLINADARLSPGFLSLALEKMEKNPRLAALTGKVLKTDKSGTPILKNGCPVIDTVGIALLPDRQAIDIGQGEVDRGQHDLEREVFGVSGAVCIYRRTALAEVAVEDQVFDEAFFAYKEDVDLSWRLRLRGWKCWYLPQAVAYHARGWARALPDRRQIPAQVRFHSFKNRRLMILKNETLLSFLPVALPILWFELRAFFYALLREPSLLKAYRAVLQELPRIRRWRKAIHNKPNPSASPAQ